jgi:hypothetical protein
VQGRKRHPPAPEDLLVRVNDGSGASDIPVAPSAGLWVGKEGLEAWFAAKAIFGRGEASETAARQGGAPAPNARFVASAEQR